ncbi:MAG: 2-isopropylmalate synthase [bacterium]
MDNKIIIFDTTLRDGEQSPGATLNTQEKIQIAKQLARLNVDIIEAGFPISSVGDFEAVNKIASEVKGPVIAALARATKTDIDRAWEAIKVAEKSRIHIFLATSDIHLQYKLKKSREEVLQTAIKAVKHARNYTDDIEFSAEDAFRSNVDYLCQVVEATIKAGAKTINIPDTVGYAIPSEFGELIKTIINKVPNIDKIILSVHCHNDLGLAVANSLAAIQNGARQVECTINGLGERAGNASLEEIVMAIKTRQPFFQINHNIKTEEIIKTSRLVSHLTGIFVQRNKAIVGENAFAHESGIHQDGFLKEKSTYEIMTPESVGLKESKLILGKHSGRHAFSARLKELGYELNQDDLEKAFNKFKDLADKKKEVYDEDIQAIIEDEVARIPEIYVLNYIHTISGNTTIPTATIKLKKGEEILQDSACGDGPVDAACKAIDRLTGIQGKLLGYNIRAITSGKDAMGEVVVKVMANGIETVGKSATTDVIEASAKAYVNAINKAIYKSMK